MALPKAPHPAEGGAAYGVWQIDCVIDLTKRVRQIYLSDGRDVCRFDTTIEVLAELREGVTGPRS